MWISVGQRTSEVGLLKALGASERDVLSVFLLEAVMIASSGGVLGLALGLGLASLVERVVPGIGLQAPPRYIALAVAVSAIVGVLAGVLPARRAARLNPVEALRAE
jgi:putative ABC transport system permease protein